MDYSEAARAAAKRQMPDVPEHVIDSLPVDPEAPQSAPYLLQSGGWVMVICAGDRALTQDDGFIVGEYNRDDEAPEEGVYVYEGPDFTAAWAALTAGTVTYPGSPPPKCMECGGRHLPWEPHTDTA
jgi:hypothetical protein